LTGHRNGHLPDFERGPVDIRLELPGGGTDQRREELLLARVAHRSRRVRDALPMSALGTSVLTLAVASEVP